MKKQLSLAMAGVMAPVSGSLRWQLCQQRSNLYR